MQRDFWGGVGAFFRGAGGVAAAPVTVPYGLVKGALRGAGTETGAAMGGVIEAVCNVGTDEEVVWLARKHMSAYPKAVAHLDHYLGGSGAPLAEDIPALFAGNLRVGERIGRLIEQRGGTSGSIVGRGADDGVPAPIRQGDYDDQDWRHALGNVDQIDFVVLAPPGPDGFAQVQVSLSDPYEWHPAEERVTQCVHEAMENMKWRHGAKNFLEVGTGIIRLKVRGNR